MQCMLDDNIVSKTTYLLLFIHTLKYEDLAVSHKVYVNQIEQKLFQFLKQVYYTAAFEAIVIS